MVKWRLRVIVFCYCKLCKTPDESLIFFRGGGGFLKFIKISRVVIIRLGLVKYVSKKYDGNIC